jgi:hypothetical protein
MGEGIGQHDDSDDQMTEMLVVFLWFIIGVGIAFVIISVICVWEFTIGIKKSINKLYNGNL